MVNHKVVGRHGKTILNSEEILSFLQQRFQQDPRITVKELVLDELTIPEQIAALAKSDVYVSPTGGGLFMAPFLPDDTVVLTTPIAKKNSEKIAVNTTIHLDIMGAIPPVCLLNKC